MADLAMPKSTSNTRTTTLGPRPNLPEQHAEPAPIAHDLHIPTAPPAPHTLTLRQIREQLGHLDLMDSIGEPYAWRAFRDAER